MKIARFEHSDGPGFGVLARGGAVDVSGQFGGCSGLFEAIGRYGLDAFRNAADQGRLCAHFKLISPIEPTAKIVGIGLNYADHVAETGRHSAGHFPVCFTRFADTLVGPEETLVNPGSSTQLDYEGELAVVIGRYAWQVTPTEAGSFVLGFACANDGSVRDFQRHTSQFTPGKNFAASGAIGPYIVTSEEVGDWRNLDIETRLNGEVVQRSSVGAMIFGVEELVSYVSQWAPLRPGDVILTGTPAGVGSRQEPPRFLKPADHIEISITALGTLRNEVAPAA